MRECLHVVRSKKVFEICAIGCLRVHLSSGVRVCSPVLGVRVRVRRY